MKFIPLPFCLSLCILWVPTIQGQAAPSVWNERRCAELAQYLEQMHQKQQFNGTVLLAEKGKTKFHRSFGFSDIQARKKFDDHASFRLASVSKQFTAMAIMLLKAQGKLDYDDTVGKHLKPFPYDDIKIKHLLHHTSGLPDYMMLMGAHWDTGKAINKRKVAFNKDVVNVLTEHKPKLLFKPGKKFQYSNTGYVVLGHLIETISKEPVGKFIEDQIFKPLQMADSFVFRPDDQFQPKHRVYGFAYSNRDSGHRPNDHHYLNGMVGDGGIYASAVDLLKWDQALYSEKLIPQSELKLAFTSAELPGGEKTGYGFGWSIDQNDGDKLQVSHGGGWVGFITYIARNVTEKRTMIVLTNHSSRSLGKVMKRIGEIAKSDSEDKK